MERPGPEHAPMTSLPADASLPCFAARRERVHHAADQCSEYTASTLCSLAMEASQRVKATVHPRVDWLVNCCTSTSIEDLEQHGY